MTEQEIMLLNNILNNCNVRGCDCAIFVSMCQKLQAAIESEKAK